MITYEKYDSKKFITTIENIEHNYTEAIFALFPRLARNHKVGEFYYKQITIYYDSKESGKTYTARTAVQRGSKMEEGEVFANEEFVYILKEGKTELGRFKSRETMTKWVKAKLN